MKVNTRIPRVFVRSHFIRRENVISTHWDTCRTYELSNNLII
jgi:hypothetical protein